MFQLNEKNMLRIMREEYHKRLNYFLHEELKMNYKAGGNEINLFQDASQLKVRHDKTGIEYTVIKYDEAAGNVVLLCPDESRFDHEMKASTLLPEADLDGDGIDDLNQNIDRMDNIINSDDVRANRKQTTDKMNLLNYKKKNNFQNKNYIVVPVDEFTAEYSL